MEEMQFQIEGRNPVLEALKADRQIEKIYMQRGVTGSVSKIIALAKQKRIQIVEADKRKLDDMSARGAHQGVIAQVSPISYVTVEDILLRAKEKNEPPLIVVLDEVEDPHNLGSVLRTANAAGAHGVIIPKHRSASLTEAAVKTSAGACFYTPVAKVTNIVQTMETLKKAGVWFTGADMAGEKDIFEADFSGGVGIVIGNEGKGISRLVKENCDFLVRIPMLGEIESLNASVSAGIFLYQAVKQRLNK